MASSGQIHPTSRGAVQWQADIPGLTQLILKMGANGLKQFAMSGVDAHTLACMLMIGELTPASNEFRLALNRHREKQRRASWWFHKLVEVGSGANFIADQLLKTRAGENVLALLTSIIPV